MGTKREIDGNGWLQVRDNPITKVGVFPYLGSEIEAPEPDRIYYVYRPAEELEKQETLDSFKLLPFIDEHTPLGNKGIPAEQKGVQGMIGEQVYFDGEYVRGNIKVLSSAAMHMIDAGKIDLSPGYDCWYEFTPGAFNGRKYDAIQRDLRGNHLALVDEGRTGPDVAMQDARPERLITIDTAELLPMEFTPEQLEQIKALIAEILSAQSTGDENPDKEKTATDELTPTEEAKADQTVAAAEEAQVALEVVSEALEEVQAAAEELSTAAEGSPVALDAAVKHRKAQTKLKLAQDSLAAIRGAKRGAITADTAAQIDRLTKRIEELAKTKPVTLDHATIIRELGARDELAERVSHFIGTFDHKSMTLDGVAKYAAGKIGLKVVEGTERIALDAWLHGRVPENQRIIAKDSAVKTGDALAAWEGK